ncbi:MAG: phage terminase large subunit [Phycisphaerales bacterium]
MATKTETAKDHETQSNAALPRGTRSARAKPAKRSARTKPETERDKTATRGAPGSTRAKPAPTAKRRTRPPSAPGSKARADTAPSDRVKPAPRRTRLAKTAPGVVDAARASVSALRRDAARVHLLTFARTYLPGHFKLEPCSMHTEIAELLERGAVGRGLRLAVAAPRGHAKSTLVSLAFVLWSVCYERERFIQIISDTADQAVDLLGAVKSELEANDLLREDFPAACELPGRPPGPERWKRSDIIARNRVRVLALGAEQKVRGRRHGADRPSLIVLDDIENEALARSPEQREARWRWLTGSVLNAGSSTTNIVLVGTVLHHDSVMARLLDPRRTQAWTTRRYKAVTGWAARKDLWDAWEDVLTGREEFQGATGPEAAGAYFESKRAEMLEGAAVLWPEQSDYQSLMAQRLAMGRVVFDAEKQNDPSDPEDALFVESDFHYWDDEFRDADELLKRLRSDGSVFGACDPSLGRAGRHADDSAIVTLLKHRPSGRLYVLDADIRRRTPDQILDTIMQYDRIRRFTSFGIEKVQFQEFLKMELERRSNQMGRHMSVRGIEQSTDKRGRIQSLQPMLTSGTILLSRRHATLIEQLRRFPHAAHDDGPDALEMAVRSSKYGEGYWVELAPGCVI